MAVGEQREAPENFSSRLTGFELPLQGCAVTGEGDTLRILRDWTV